MNLPRQVQEREEQANQAIERLRQPPQATPPSEPPPEQQVVQPPAIDWESRYKTLQGKYNAEVPRLSELVRSQQEQIETLKREVDSLKARAPAADTRADLAADLPDELRERFDPDMIRAVTHIAANSAERVAAEIRPVVEKVQAQDSQRAQQLLMEQRKAEMLEALDDLASGWEKLDANPAFVTFLQQTDPATGKPLQDTLTAAVQRFDAATAARIFNRFASTLKTTTAAPRLPDLAAQLVPDLAGAGSSAPAGDKRIFTAAEAKAEYTRAAGLINRNPQLATKIERDIDQAYAEGRVR